MTTIIDSIAETDIDAIMAMAAELSMHEGMPPPELTYDKLHDVLFGANAFVAGRIARRNVEPVGYSLWITNYDMQYGTRMLEIIDLFVKPDYRRRGIARSLMREMADVAEQCGYRFMIVKSFNENQEANAFYPSCGAKLDKTNVYYLSRKEMAAL